MNDSSCELKALYAKNDSRLWIIWATLDHELCIFYEQRWAMVDMNDFMLGA